MTYDEFAQNYLYIDAAQHNFQVAIQAALDAGSLILAERSRELPKTYKDIFPALAGIGVLPPDLAQRLTIMAKFRNVLVHQYLEVDLSLVYRYLQEKLDDFEVFLRLMSDWLLANAED